MTRILTEAEVEAITASAPNSNALSVLSGLDALGEACGLHKPHRLAVYLSQLLHESEGFRYDREIWGPTPAQKRYDVREDLGNTPERDGDGEKYKGRGPIQITGKANYTEFRDWCTEMGMAPPDFVADPDAVNSDPWEGIGPLWYWTTRKINARAADEGDVRRATRLVNGGYNGLPDRWRRYVRASLVLLGYERDALLAFQSASPHYTGEIDGLAGPATHAALHAALCELPERIAELEPDPTPEPTPEPVTSDRPSFMGLFLSMFSKG